MTDGGQKIGRPSKLTDEVREKAATYYQECMEAYAVPTAAQLGVILDVNKSTLYEWAKHDTEFSNTLGNINNLQEAMLLKGGLESKLNTTIVKLMLSNHGYSDKTDVTTNGKDLAAPILVQFVGDDADDTDS